MVDIGIEFDAAGAQIVEQVYQTCMMQWATQISAGGEIQLEIAGLKVPEAIKIMGPAG